MKSKKLVGLALAGLMALSLTACGNSGSPSATATTLQWCPGYEESPWLIR